MALLVCVASFTTQAEGEVVKTAYCPHCQQTVDFAPFNAATMKKTDGHYSLTAAVTRTQVLKTDGAATDMVLDLNGYAFTCSAYCCLIAVSSIFTSASATSSSLIFAM